MSATDTDLIAEENYAQGFYYQHGIKGHEKDLQKAYEYYKRAADAGRIDAEYALGDMFESALNYPEAFRWYRLALERWGKFAKAESEYIRIAKILGYEAVVKVLDSMGRIPPAVPRKQSLAMLLPSDSPLATNKGPPQQGDYSNIMREDYSSTKRP
ncbi:MAG: hypothetical protein K0R48_1123 [Gammaproteobacteria bacterium]|jgi:tetratricopeptide (TPR) repeat protein|nr:hypothetical protein [Gammaproteobacteria bacterium]